MSRKINMIVVHCTDSTWGTAHDIDQWHKKRGWSGIGYHYVIRNTRPGPDGQVEDGRPVSRIGAHARGYNSSSIGIALVGKGGYYTIKQIKALVALCGQLMLQYDLVPADIFCHNQFSPKSCPDFRIDELRYLLTNGGS